jgi:hypothetical protein
MHSLDSRRYVQALEKFAPTLPFGQSKSEPQSPRPNRFFVFDSLRIICQPVWLHGHHERQGKFYLRGYQLQLCNAQFRTFHRTKRQPLGCDLRQRIRGQHEQSKSDHHQFRHKLSHHFPSQCFWRRLLDRRGGATREPKSGQQRYFHCELRTQFPRWRIGFGFLHRAAVKLSVRRSDDRHRCSDGALNHYATSERFDCRWPNCHFFCRCQRYRTFELSMA